MAAGHVVHSGLPSAVHQRMIQTEPFWAHLEASSLSDSGDGAMESYSAASQPATPTPNNDAVVKLPMNAVELIAAAIDKCDTPYPTVTQIATYIHDHVSTYHDHDLAILIKLVYHHLISDAHNYFLPVRASGSQSLQKPAISRWALNRQAVVVSVDGSLVRRRYHPYSYRQHSGSPYTTTTASPSVLISPSGSKMSSSHRQLTIPTYPTATYGAPLVSGMTVTGTLVGSGKVVGGPIPRFSTMSTMSGGMYGPSIAGTGVESQAGLTYLY